MITQTWGRDDITKSLIAFVFIISYKPFELSENRDRPGEEAKAARTGA